FVLHDRRLVQRPGLQHEREHVSRRRRRLHQDPGGAVLRKPGPTPGLKPAASRFGRGDRRGQQSGPMHLPFRRVDPTVPLPAYARAGDAALDLASNVDVELGAGERAMIPTGLAVAIPEGYAGLVLPRSGLASREG